jgi:hypothetical protein
MFSAVSLVLGCAVVPSRSYHLCSSETYTKPLAYYLAGEVVIAMQ